MSTSRFASRRLVSVIAISCLATGCKIRHFGERSSQKSESGVKQVPAVYIPGNRKGWGSKDPYLDEVQPLLAARCVACHSCTSAPCQLNLTSFDTLVRGASQSKPYSAHLPRMPEGPTRYADDLSIAQWREKKFFSVLDPVPKESVFASAIADQGALDPALLGKAKAHLASEAYTCPKSSAEWPALVNHGMTRMPAALPALEEGEKAILQAWLERGAPGPAAEAKAVLHSPGGGNDTASRTVRDWEQFLNGDSVKSQLVGRYVYEHSFLARIHFQETPDEFYELVRSTTPPGQPIAQIVTEWIQDAPPSRAYYRLRRIPRIIDARQHALWEVSNKTLGRLKELFEAPQWEVGALPGYGTLNPFEVFQAIPAKSRAAFMRENAKMLYQAYARGPICVGPLATYAVDEHFWIWFLNDDADPSVRNPTLGLRSYAPFYDRDRDVADSFRHGADLWGESDYQRAFSRELKKTRPGGLTLEDVWDGGKSNPNAWLVVTRNEVSTTVHTGTELSYGGLPSSAWLMSYANFERMYYNGAVQFKFWGSAKHKLESFDHQIHTRTEAEDLFLSILQPPMRAKYRQEWNSKLGLIANRIQRNYTSEIGSRAKPEYDLQALATDQWTRVGEAVRGAPDGLNGWPIALIPPKGESLTVASVEEFEARVSRLTRRAEPFVRNLPNLMFVRIDGKDTYSFITNRGYRRDKLVFTESMARRPEKDELVVIKGLSGSTPELFLDVPLNEAGPFLASLARVSDRGSFEALKSRWAVRRDSSRFWSVYDWFNDYSYRQNPREAGVLDLNFYDLH